jgi:hypothetical protein
MKNFIKYLFLSILLTASTLQSVDAQLLGDARVRVASGSVCDTDALLYINNANITDNTQQEAICQLVTDLKDNLLWDKIVAIYPMVGGTASTHKWNLKDPRDLDVAFRLTFTGGWVHSSTGSKPDGSTGYANTYLKPLSELPTNNMSISYYSRENITTGTDQLDMGARDGNILYLSAIYGASGLEFVARNSHSGTLASASNSDARGFYTASKLGNVASGFKIYKNTTLEDTKVGNGANPNRSVYLGCYNNAGSAQLFSNRECAIASIGEGLTGSEVSDFYNAVQTFQTTLGREI